MFIRYTLYSYTNIIQYNYSAHQYRNLEIKIQFELFYELEFVIFQYSYRKYKLSQSR